LRLERFSLDDFTKAYRVSCQLELVYFKRLHATTQLVYLQSKWWKLGLSDPACGREVVGIYTDSPLVCQALISARGMLMTKRVALHTMVPMVPG